MELADRMKRYEHVSKGYLMTNTPVIIRIDGKAFHTWTKGLQKPFDPNFYAAMAKTAMALVNNIQNAVLAYGQSDEISILLKDYTAINTEQWYSSNVQKMTSISASLATGYFNEYTRQLHIGGKLAFFDSRVFNLPQTEVCNYFIWRQKDFMRNSVQSVARHYLGHKGCLNKSVPEMKSALMELNPPVSWEMDYEPIYKLGYAYIKGAESVSHVIPPFTEAREFVDYHVYSKEGE